MYGEEERCIHSIGGETRGKETTWMQWHTKGGGLWGSTTPPPQKIHKF
jgi:hypothetical protein